VVDASLGGRRGALEATLTPSTRGGFTIRVDSEPRGGWSEGNALRRSAVARRRRSFRIAHELAHTLYYDRDACAQPRRVTPWCPAEEQFCDDFARALLVPPSVVRRMPLTAESAFKLQLRFDVSLEVAARSIAATHPECDVAVWFWERGPRSREALLRQWASVRNGGSLRDLRETKLVAAAMAEGQGIGQAPSPRERRGKREWVPATASARFGQRQLVVVALTC
jgi:hypothetical protein